MTEYSQRTKKTVTLSKKRESSIRGINRSAGGGHMTRLLWRSWPPAGDTEMLAGDAN